MGEVSVEALKGIDLSIQKGDFVSVVGHSGAGKTTIMNVIGLIDKPTSGSVRISGQEVTALGDREVTELRHTSLGFIFQSFNLLPVLDVAENVELPLLLGKKYPPKKEREERVEHLLEEVGLADRMRHRPGELSGGQLQRVAIARALVTNPPIVIADEPTANLDSQTSENILRLMLKMNEEHKTTFIFSTHDMVIKELAVHVISLKDGLIVGEEKKTR